MFSERVLKLVSSNSNSVTAPDVHNDVLRTPSSAPLVIFLLPPSSSSPMM